MIIHGGRLIITLSYKKYNLSLFSKGSLVKETQTQGDEWKLPH